MTNETLVSSEPFLGQWHQLVSTTNWEKGRIILEWRQSLIQRGASATEYSDEAWSQLVQGVTPQHVGRLRRVYERFGAQADSFAGLYWSHFHAAGDWDDAEMWLEGAVQNGWSVSQMRRQRWETLGSIPAEEPLEDQVVSSELDEDVPLDAVEETMVAEGSQSGDGYERETINDSDHTAARRETDAEEPRAGAEEAIHLDAPPRVVRPFAELPELPPDVDEAFESYKLAIVRHRLEGWREISQADMVASLQSLIQLAERLGNKPLARSVIVSCGHGRPRRCRAPHAPSVGKRSIVDAINHLPQASMAATIELKRQAGKSGKFRFVFLGREWPADLEPTVDQNIREIILQGRQQLRRGRALETHHQLLTNKPHAVIDAIETDQFLHRLIHVRG